MAWRSKKRAIFSWVWVAVLIPLPAINHAWFGVAPAIAQQESAGFQTITPEDLAQLLEEKNFELVNVHIPYEGEIAQTDAFIPFDQIGSNLDSLPADKGAKIVLYCKSGRMSEIAANELVRLGYRDVLHVAGGFVAWTKAGHELLER